MPAQSFDPDDRRRLRRAMAQASETAGASVADLLPQAGPLGDAALRAGCTFAHRAVLLFPTTVGAALSDFTSLGLAPLAPVPSVLVRHRLCARYGLDPDSCDVSVTRLRTPSSGALHNLEVFLFPMTAGALSPRLVDAERELGFEDHLAFEVATPDIPTLDQLVSIFRNDAGLVFEGGGHNPHEGSTGSTVLYFVGRRSAMGSNGGPRFERFELYCKGDFSTIIDRHPVDDHAVAEIYGVWSGTRDRSAASAA